MSDMASELGATGGEPEYVYDESSGAFWMSRPDRSWICIKEGALRRELMKRGLSHKIDPAVGKISPLDARIREIEQEHRVSRALFVAGYRAGFHDIGGERILVTRELALVQRKEGEWKLLEEIFRRLLVGEMETMTGTAPVDQRDHFFAWLQHTLRSLYDGRVTRGLWLHVAGDPGCGKSLLRDILVAVTGGRMGKPYKWMIDREEFNRDMFGAVMQVMDDDNADTDIEARKNLAAKGKQIVADGAIYLRAMFNDGFVFKPMWRLLTLTNIEAEALLVMPPITKDIADKIMMLRADHAPFPTDDERAKGASWPMPMPTNTPAQIEAFWRAIEAELPAFVFWLLECYEAPSHIAGQRFGVVAWQHPEILKELQKFSPHIRLWQQIEASGVVFRKDVGATDDEPDRPRETIETEEWEGTPSELRALLVGHDSRLNIDEKKKVNDPAWLGQRLTSLGHERPDLVVLKRTGRGRRWHIRRCVELAQ